jgi:hypothetical protein
MLRMARGRSAVVVVFTLAVVGCGALLTPVAPSATQYMWPSRQTEFQRGSGSGCTGRVTMAVGRSAVCFNAADDRLRCAGLVGGVNVGSSFVDFGIGGVDQIVFHRDAAGQQVADVCVRTIANKVSCRGSHAPSGAAAWSAWGDPADDYVAIASDGATKLCALNACGAIRCSDFTFGAVATTTAGHNRFFVAPTASLTIDDPTIFRMQNGLPFCMVQAGGLDCAYTNPGFGVPWGTPGQVVDGTMYAGPDPDFPGSLGYKIGCWLSSNGTVQCRQGTTTVSRFGLPMLAIAGDFDTTTLCGVSDDAALWCRGDNTDGKLGNGTTTALPSETRVVPPLTVFVGCGTPTAPPICPPAGTPQPAANDNP